MRASGTFLFVPSFILEMVIMRKQIKLLSLYRVIATASVLLFHYTTRFFEVTEIDGKFPFAFPYGGEFGVGLLFIVTSFLSVFTTEKETSGLHYFLKRLARLWPVYAVCIVITATVTWLFYPPLSPSLLRFLVNFTMLQKLAGFSGVDGAYWTLSYQLLFYAVIAVVIGLKKKDKLPLIAVVWTAICIPLSALKWAGIDHSLLKLIRMGMISDYFSYFAIGILASFLYREHTKETIRLSVVGAALCLINQFFSQSIAGLIMLLIEIGLMLLISCKLELPGWLDHKVLYFFSDISYPLYLLHQYIGYVILHRLWNMGMTSAFVILVPFAVITILSAVLHRFVELPASRLTARYLKPRKQA